MAVQFNEDKKIFRLDTETSTYLMGLTPEVYRDFWHTSAKQYMKGHEQEWQHTDSLLNVQLENAKEWRNTCLKYFQTFSKKDIE